MKIEEQTPEAVKEALNKKELSVNGGYEITKQVQRLPSEEREQAAVELIERKKRAGKWRKRTLKSREKVKSRFLCGVRKSDSCKNDRGKRPHMDLPHRRASGTDG